MWERVAFLDRERPFTHSTSPPNQQNTNGAEEPHPNALQNTDRLTLLAANQIEGQAIKQVG